MIEVVDGKVQLGSIDARRGALSKTDKIHFADHTFCKSLTKDLNGTNRQLSDPRREPSLVELVIQVIYAN